MILGLDAVLSAEELGAVRAQLAGARFVDGKVTAGWHARGVKENSQTAADDVASTAARTAIEAALRRHPVFTPAVQPKTIHLLVNLYGPGQSYGRHVDDAFMAGRR